MKSRVVFLALLSLLVAPLAGVAAERVVHVGTILEVSPQRMELAAEDSVLYIGFYAEASALKRLAQVRVGDEVRAVFDTGTPPGETDPINRLVDIRRCAGGDRQCAADRKAANASAAMEARARADSERRHGQCQRAMDEALAKDPRYVAPVDSDAAQAEAMLRESNSFVGSRRVCADAVLAGQRAAVFDACQAHRCGEGIGGGCAHLAGYAVSDAAIRRAVLECRAK